MKKRSYGLRFLLVLITVISLSGCKKISNEENSAEADERIEQAIESGIPAVIVSNAVGEPGDTVTVTAMLVNNPGILGSSMTLSYDEEVIRLKKIENGDAFKDTLNLSHSKELKNGCIFLWDGESLTEDQIVDGEMLSMEFEIIKEPKENVSSISLSCHKDGTVDNNMECVELTSEKGTITVQE